MSTPVYTSTSPGLAVQEPAATAPEPVVETPAPPPAGAATTEAPAATETTKRRSLEDTLSALGEQDKTFVLDAVRSARSEAKNLRDRAKSADDTRAELMAEVSKALGLTTEAPPDPAALSAQLSEVTATARQAAVELAVYRASATAGGDPNALLDSVSFVKSLTGVDPSDAGAITAKVAEAVKANPALGLAPVRRAPGANPAAGSSAGGAPDLEAQIAEAMKAGNVALAIHLQNQKLAPARR